MDKMATKCENCGKFISYKDMAEGRANFHFIPDSQLGPEESYWECKKCNKKEQK